MPLSGLPRTSCSSIGAVKVVDGIPANCCGGRRRRRPTVMTELTYPCSDNEDDINDDHDDELSNNGFAVAISEDSEDDHEHEHDDDDDDGECSDDLLGADPSKQQEVQVLSLENLSRRKRTGGKISRLLKENQRLLESLIHAPSATKLLHQQQQCIGEESSTLRLRLTVEQQHATQTQSKPTSSWKDGLQFEIQQTLPGVASLVVYCIAHASTYELISNLAYEALESSNPTSTLGAISKTRLYTGVLVIGCLLARFSGLVWDFVGPLSYQRVKYAYHNRIRLGAKDAVGLSWLQAQSGEATLGCLHIASYYMCYIAVVFFVGRLAVLCDQREVLLANMPSTLYQQGLDAMNNEIEEEPLYMCPVRDYSPRALFGSSNVTIDNYDCQWDPTACSGEQSLEIFGLEDDGYFYQSLSKNSYDHFFGQDYETAFFDSTHQVLFYASLATMAIYALKAGLGYSFWAGW